MKLYNPKLVFYRKISFLPIFFNVIFFWVILMFLPLLLFGEIHPSAYVFLPMMLSFFSAAFVYMFYITFIDKRPLVELNEKGIKVLYHQPVFAKWEEISDIYYKESFICLRVKPSKISKKQSLWYKTQNHMNIKAGYGELNIWGIFLKSHTHIIHGIIQNLMNEKDKRKRLDYINHCIQLEIDKK